MLIIKNVGREFNDKLILNLAGLNIRARLLYDVKSGFASGCLPAGSVVEIVYRRGKVDENCEYGFLLNGVRIGNCRAFERTDAPVTRELNEENIAARQRLMQMYEDEQKLKIYLRSFIEAFQRGEDSDLGSAEVIYFQKRLQTVVQRGKMD